MNDPKLRKSRDRLLAGVCGGIAEFLGWDPVPLRTVCGVLTVLSGFFPGMIVYAALALVMPPPADTGFHLGEHRRQ